MSSVIEFPAVPTADRKSVEEMAKIIVQSRMMAFVAIGDAPDDLICGYRAAPPDRLAVVGLLQLGSQRLVEEMFNGED